ncbi:helix-turn-helix domain-containing protein [Ruminococcus sp.]|uniref:helix-turn-helix domain-containing protein n=1 Tax=Ruminococcus sp. TaxID=41978 RepID=UPI002E77A394|nr:helix-turn-helix transcriptional regulator [Ruminococcus sp.]MEE0023940.1 helix-turn-helix transcriptional regulator [Ruminococcus sp.]
MNVDNLKSARKSTGMTQKDVSTALNISPNTYKNYEQGLREPNGDTIVALANLFGVTTDYLLGRPDAKPPEDPIKLAAQEFHLDSAQRGILAAYLYMDPDDRKQFIAYIKQIVDGVDKEDKSELKMSRVYEAARSTDPNNAPHFAEYPEEELKKLDDDPDTDFDL